MSLNVKVKTTCLEKECGAEDAETLLAWLLANPRGSLNLKQCTHLHAAVLQVLMKCSPTISVLPESELVTDLLRASGVIRSA
tara:strand:+ start:7410 stop:7655 length:246 start_codon:yes stop_codon:yes gene_type:complete